MLDRLKSDYGGLGVECLAVTTYYKKNPETGQIEADMTADAEWAFADKLHSQEGLSVQMACTKDEAELKYLGLSGLPYFVVVGPNGRLLFSHTMNSRDKQGTDLRLLRAAIETALKQ